MTGTDVFFEFVQLVFGIVFFGGIAFVAFALFTLVKSAIKGIVGVGKNKKDDRTEEDS